MAQISLMLQGEVRVGPLCVADEVLSIELAYDLPSLTDTPIPYARDSIFLHGSVDHLECLARAILRRIEEARETIPESQERKEYESETGDTA